uniref:Ubiquitin-like domain-containing protein n=1 Tax=Parascaris univalens TaxID=6257 RepID=A0A915ADV9_PARUN
IQRQPQLLCRTFANAIERPYKGTSTLKCRAACERRFACAILSLRSARVVQPYLHLRTCCSSLRMKEAERYQSMSIRAILCCNY